MEKQYTKESLENLRIHELRDLARKVQIKSPTTLKKEDVIEQILDVVSGNKPRYVKTNKKGRPPKATTDWLDFLVPETLSNNDDKPLYAPVDGRFDMCINEPEVEFNKPTMSTQSGYFDVLPAGYGALRTQGYLPTDHDVYVAPEIMADNGLVAGMCVKCEARHIKDRPLIMTKVLEHEEVDTLFEDIPFAAKSRQIAISTREIGSLKVETGSRHLINCSSKDNFAVGYNIARSLAPKYNVMYVNFNSLPENNAQSDKFEMVNIPFEETEVNQTLALNLVVSRAKVLMAQNKDVVLVIKGVSGVLRSLSTALSGVVDTNTVDPLALRKFKQMLTCAKSADKGSLTLIMIDNPTFTSNGVRDLIKYELGQYFTVTEVK